MTRREAFEIFAGLVDYAAEEQRDDLRDVLDKEFAAIEKKNASARARAAKKRAEGDALKAEIAGLLNSEAQVAQDIIDALGREDITPAKVAARMKVLCNEGVAEREYVKIDGRKLVGYKLASC